MTFYRWFTGILFVLILGGCAGLGGIQSDDPRFEKAYDNARQAVNLADQVKAKQYQADQFQTVLNRLTELREKQNSKPEKSILDNYRRVQRKAYRIGHRSLQSRLKEARDTVRDQKQRIESLSSDIEDLEKDKQSQSEVVSDLQDDKQRLEAKISTLQDSATENLQLRIKLENRNERIATLQQRIEVLQKLEKRAGNLNERVDQLKSRVKSKQAEIKELEESNADLKQQVQNYKQRVETLESKQTSADSGVLKTAKKLERLKMDVRRQNRNLVSIVEERLEDANVRREDGRVIVDLGSVINFDLASIELDSESTQALDKLAKVLSDVFPRYDIRVLGHTDDLQLRSRVRDRFPSNWELSAHRASATARYFIDEYEIDPDRFAVEAYSKYRPLVPNDSSENRRQNRRVELELIPSQLELWEAIEGIDTTP